MEGRVGVRDGGVTNASCLPAFCFIGCEKARVRRLDDQWSKCSAAGVKHKGLAVFD